VQRRRMRIPRRAVLIVAVFLILLAEVGHAQMSAGRFRIDARVGQSKKGTPVYSGYIYNDGGGSGANIRLLVEALDAEGKVIGQAQGAALGSMLAAIVSTSKCPSRPQARAIEYACCRGRPSPLGNEAQGSRRGDDGERNAEGLQGRPARHGIDTSPQTDSEGDPLSPESSALQREP
jgi:hypothetical protein